MMISIGRWSLQHWWCRSPDNVYCLCAFDFIFYVSCSVSLTTTVTWMHSRISCGSYETALERSIGSATTANATLLAASMLW